MAEGRTKWPAVEDDWFVEPSAVTSWLLARETFVGRIYDPCCGQGNIVEACLAAGLDARGSDLRERVGAVGKSWFGGRGDFRSMVLSDPNVISNPPYGRAKLTEAFIYQFWNVSPAVHKLAVFTNAKFLFGSGRAMGLFTMIPPSRVWPVNPRPSCPPGQFLVDGGKASGGVENFCWLVWDRSAAPGTMIHWNPVGAPREISHDPGELRNGGDKPVTDHGQIATLGHGGNQQILEG